MVGGEFLFITLGSEQEKEYDLISIGNYINKVFFFFNVFKSPKFASNKLVSRMKR